MTVPSRPTAILLRHFKVDRDLRTQHVVLSAEGERDGWSRALSARAARVLWDGLTTNLFAGAGEKFVHVAQTALFQPEKDPAVTDWVQVSRDPSGLIEVRGLSTGAPERQNWSARFSAADGQELWRDLETLLFSEVRGRARPQAAQAPLPAGPLRRSIPAAGGVQLACEESPGGAPALLFVHGAFCDHSVWRYQVAQFAGHYRCVAPDMRGHGGSDKPYGSYLAETWAEDLERVIATLEMRNLVVIGHSMGASAVMQLASATRHELKGLVLIEPAAIVDDREAELFAQFALGQENSPGFGVRFRRRVQELLGDELAPQIAEPLRRMMMATPGHVAAGIDEALFTFATGLTATRVRVPALVLLAAHRFEDARFFRRYMRSAEVRVGEDVSHFPMLATPGRVNAAIGEFLQNLPALSAPEDQE